MCGVNSALQEHWKELSLSTISREALLNGESNKETLDVNRTYWQQ